MKRAIIFAILFLAVAISASYAHAPSNIKISFDRNTKVLQVVIMHSVNDPLKHYVKKVDVRLNKRGIISQIIPEQDNSESQALTYIIPGAKIGDLISVEASCSDTGRFEKEYKVE